MSVTIDSRAVRGQSRLLQPQADVEYMTALGQAWS